MKDWKIGTRIAAGFAAVILATFAFGMVAVFSVRNIAGNTHDLTAHYYPSAAALRRVQTNVYHEVADLLQIVQSNDPAVIARLDKGLDSQFDDSAKQIEGYLTMPVAPDERTEIDKLKSARAAFRDKFNEVLKIGQSVDPAEDLRAEKVYDEQLRPLYAEYTRQLQALVELNERRADASAAETVGAVNRTYAAAWIGILLCVSIAVPIAYFLIRSITGRLERGVAALHLLAQGDMTVSIEATYRDELGEMAEALNATIRTLRETMRNVQDAAILTSSSSRNVSAAVGSIASRSQTQAASLEETSASMEQITATVKQSADSARQANQIASQSRDTAIQGKDVVNAAVRAMEEINESSARISDIISTIDEIAFQTNLLAVNAAVEAARAGEQGRGFAVVASEVRSLAGRSANAAKEIKGLIQDSLRKVEKGSELVNRSGETLEGIVGSVTRVTDIISEIAAAAEEQSRGIEQVNLAVTQMDHATQATSSETDALDSSAHHLAGQSEHLQALVSAFQLGERSSPAPDTGFSPAPASVRPTAPPSGASGRVRTSVRTVATVRSSTRPSAAAAPPRRAASSSAAALAAVAPRGGAGTREDESFEEF